MRGFRLRARLLGVSLLTLFPAFPNPHVRSNGFMMARQTFLALRPPRVRFKGQAWLFESGRASLTRRVLRRGERCVVVGCDGVAYDVEEWPTSQTFWQGGQENLLVGDNRTSAYAKADAGRQRVLSRAAWQRR